MKAKRMIPMGAVAVLVAAVVANPARSPERRSWVRVIPAAAFPEESAQRSVPQVRRNERPLPPAFQAPEDPEQLSAWLLGLPDDEMARLVDSRELGRWVGRVVDHLSRQPGSEDGHAAWVDSFLTQINYRIEAAQSRLKRGERS